MGSFSQCLARLRLRLMGRDPDARLLGRYGARLAGAGVGQVELKAVVCDADMRLRDVGVGVASGGASEALSQVPEKLAGMSLMEEFKAISLRSRWESAGQYFNARLSMTMVAAPVSASVTADGRVWVRVDTKISAEDAKSLGEFLVGLFK